MADQFDGMGGSYVVESGKRRLVHNTQDHPDGNRAREAVDEDLTKQKTISGTALTSSSLSGGAASGLTDLSKNNGGE